MTNALITGVTGQDGAYLAQLLLDKGYTVYGAYRRTASTNFWRVEELGIKWNPQFHLVEYDVTDLASSIRLLERTGAGEVYNLAAQSFVATSFDQAITTAHSTALGPLNLLEAIRIASPRSRFYQASTSEMFGKARTMPQCEDTPFYPRSPYAVAKLYAHWMTINYRESYGIFGASGILFNHESPLRGLEFVTRKITDGVARLEMGRVGRHRGSTPQVELPFLELGDLNAKRDWGYAKEYVEGMWRMLQAEAPDSFVLATGRTESVREFVCMAFKAVGVDLEFRGCGDQEMGVVAAVNDSSLVEALGRGERGMEVGQTVVRVNPRFYRPAEVEMLVGNSEKARRELGWSPETTLEQLCQKMVEADLKRVERGESF